MPTNAQVNTNVSNEATNGQIIGKYLMDQYILSDSEYVLFYKDLVTDRYYFFKSDATEQ